MSIDLSDIRLEYSQNMRSFASFQNGVLHIRLSRFLSNEEKKQVYRRFLKWAEKKMARRDYDYWSQKVKYRDGESIVTINGDYRLKFCYTNNNFQRHKVIFFRLSKGVIQIIGDKNTIQDSKNTLKIQQGVLTVIGKDKQNFLEQTLQRLNQNIGGVWKKCAFKRQIRRFGSCTARGAVYVSSRLLLAPSEVFEYVCIHELAHLKEFNHSERFWKIVEKADPEYWRYERWLKNNGFLL